MEDKILLKKIRISQLDLKDIEELKTILLTTMPKKMLDPEDTLYELYKEMKKEQKKNKKAEKKLKEAEKMILNIGATLGRNKRIEHATYVAERGMIGRHIEDISTRIADQQTIEISKLRDIVFGKGNSRFTDQKIEAEMSGKKQTKKEYDAILVICSDAREIVVDFELASKHNILVIQVAGNVYDKEDPIAAKLIEKGLKKLKKGGNAFFIGHNKCGAVHACEDVHEKGEQSLYTKVSPKVSKLIQNVDDTEIGNAKKQAERLRDNSIVMEKDVQVIAAVYDIETGEIEFIDAKESELGKELGESSKRQVSKAKESGHDMSKQYAHTILVVADAENFKEYNDPSTIFDMIPNQTFGVNANGDKISECAIASIEYALKNVKGVKEMAHLLILATKDEIARRLKIEMEKQSEIIREALRTGYVTIAIYDPETGRVQLKET